MIKLDKYETALLLATKKAQHKDFDNEVYSWDPERQESILNGYDNVVFTFLQIICIEPQFLVLKDLNMRLLDLLFKVKPTAYKRIFEEIQGHRHMASTGYGIMPASTSKSPAQAIFSEVYGFLQSVAIKEKSGNDYINLFDMDDSLMKF